jgi:RNA polymerase sigma-70 factor, ECF subfamily
VAHQSDQILAKQILAGDHEACVQLVRSHYAPIYRLLVRLCGDVHQAEDLTQETFSAAWEKIGGFTGASSLSTWLHRIAYRKFLDTCRHRKKKINGHSSDKIDHVICQSPPPLEEALAIEEFEQLHQAINCLKPAEKSVIVFYYLQGLSHQEVADVTGEPSGTVRWRARRALENLREWFNGKEKHGRKPTTIP